MANHNYNVSSTIPIQKRGKRAQYTISTIAILFLTFGSYFCEEKNKFFAFGLSITVWSLLIMVTEILHRLALVVEELCHIPSRYDTMQDILTNAFKFSPEFIAVFIVLLFIVFYIYLTYGNPLQLTFQLGWTSVLNLVGAIMLNTLLRPKYGPLCQALSIGNINGLDYGSAMAYSFFHGYLQIVLPHKGTEQKGIQELMQDFASKHQVEFIHDKLLVLIPLSLHCPPSMATHSKIAELAQSLQDIQVSRAGVSKRSYKSTAYKITENNKKGYVCVEYATPLQTLHDIIKHRNEHASDYEVQRKELALQFYLTTQLILNNNPDCKDCCDLIFFDDKTENGEFKDVGEVVLEHLAKNGKNKNKKI